MKRFSILTLLSLLTLTISACGARAAQPTPPPTLNPLDLQNTVVAEAFTMVAQTQAAVPTATPTTPPTSTPPPTATFPPLPTLDATFTPVPGTNAGSADPCIHQVLPAVLEGKPIRMRVDNSTKVTLNVTVYLNSSGPQGTQSQCGYRAYTLEAGQFIVLNNLVEGCYTLWAWNPDPAEYFIVTNGTSCLDGAQPWAFDISTGSIRLRT